jgi:hypothetical protein
VFNGKLVRGSTAKGVFFGWGDNGGTKTVSNCLYIQQDGQGTDNLDLVKMNAGSVAVTDCYKTAEVGTYGTLAYLNPPIDATLFVERTAVDGTKFYVVLRNVSLSGSGTEEAPYIISKASQWDEFADLVSRGYTFVGKFFKLNENISVTKKVGVVKSDGTLASPFSGTFDGGGFTITASIEDEDNPGTALFSYISGATIKNLTLAGSVTGGIHAAGLVGFSNGTGNKIENCVVSATINGGSHIGGILGHVLTSDISIDNCVFKGELVGGETAKGIFVGWGDNGGTKSVSNCLYIQQDGQKTDNLDLVRMSAGTVTVRDCYKTEYVGLYGTLVFLSVASIPLNAINSVEKRACDGTIFYVVPEYMVTSATMQMFTGTYRVSDDVSVNERILINGNVKLILDEGKTLTASKGIELSQGNKLTIDGKGMLNAYGETNNSGIGANDVGTLIIEDGVINATGGSGAAGIGGSIYNIGGGTIIINGGDVSATGGAQASGIGGGRTSVKINAIDIFITGGVCGTIVINGGRVTAKQRNSDYYGIGPGYDHVSSGTVTLGWTNEDDFIYADRYYKESIKFADDKPFYYEVDGKNMIVKKINEAKGKILRPLYDDVNSLKYANVSGVKPYYSYTDEEIALTFKVTDIEGKELVEGVDYTASLNGSPVKDVFIVKDAGEYTLTITAKENGAYTGSKNVNFTVAKRSLENATVSGVQPCYSYTGEEISLTYKVTDFEGKELVEGTDYTASLNGTLVKDVFIVKDIGDYTFTITAKDGGFYTGSKTVSFSVAPPYIISSKKDWDDFAASVNEGETYSGKYIKLNDNISVSTKVGVRNGSQDRAFSGVFDGGGHTITADITDKDNSGTALFGYIIGATKKNLT